MLVWRTVRLAAVLLACAVCAPVGADTYFVASSAHAASDGIPANGTAERPWATLSSALGQMKGGDTLYVKRGLYEETGLLIPPALSGTPGKPTRIQAWPGDSVSLSGQGADTGEVCITGCASLVFSGFTITNFAQGVCIEASTNITLQDCVLAHLGQEGVAIRQNSRHILVQGCVVSVAGLGQGNAAAIAVGSGPTEPLDNTGFVTLRSNRVYSIPGSAVAMQSGTHECTVEQNTVFGCRSAGSGGAIDLGPATQGQQSWGADPQHVVRGNLVYGTDTAIRAGTGCLLVNNVIHSLRNAACGILVNNEAGDSYSRRIWHNTIAAPAEHAIWVASGAAEIKNNLGPALTNNLALAPAYFVNAGAHDYHLAPGTPAVDAGVDLSSLVAEDLEGKPRPRGRGPDLGAFERQPMRPAPPGALRVLKAGP